MKGSILLSCIMLFVISVFFSCKKSLDPKSYIHWVKDEVNGLHLQKKIAPLKVDLLYTPIDYQIINNLKLETIPNTLYKEELKRLGNFQYYHLKLSILESNGKIDVGNYQVTTMTEQQKRLGYLSFGMQKDIYLVEKEDTLPCIVYHYEQGYDIKPERSFLLAFEGREAYKNETKTFVLNSSVFGTGPIKIQIEASNLSNIPYLKTQS